jgi:acetoin:2,6-dichlorophenolindophenol oxidoreductase subunit alpha
MAISRQKSIELYRTMFRIRTFEERVSREMKAGKIVGAAHLYVGEEAVATGACASLRPDDYVVSTHRGHGHMIAKGAETRRMMAELFGKKTGYCKGKGGSMHLADADIGVLGANGIVGASMPIAAGAALSARMRGTTQVAIAFLGDGASNRGTFHESVNLAACWRLPVVFVIENNLYAEKTRISDTCRLVNISDRAAAYGITGVTVYGNDVEAVYQTVGEAVEKARKGEGPTLVECKTYRWHGHYEGDSQTYKSKEEMVEWMKKDPLASYREWLIKNGVATKSQADEIELAIANEIDEAVQYAQESPLPAPEETLEDVFA